MISALLVLCLGASSAARAVEEDGATLLPARHPIAVAIGPLTDGGGFSGDAKLPLEVLRDRIALQLASAGVFADQRVVEGLSDALAAEEILALRQQGFQAVLVGTAALARPREVSFDIARFSAKVDSKLERQSFAVQVVVGPLVTALGVAESAVEAPVLAALLVAKQWTLHFPPRARGEAVLRLDGVRLIDTSSGEVLWEGSASGTSTGESSAVERASKEMIRSLARQLAAASLSPAAPDPS